MATDDALNILAAGLSHHTASVAAREALALSPEQARALLRAVHAEDVLEELLVLQTCNRTEFYAVTRKPGDAVEYLLAHVQRVRGRRPRAEALACRDGRDAVRHLFRVAAGLDSQAVGEPQVLGQLKDAYRTALEERTAQFFLNKLLHAAFRVGKRARSETDLAAGATSVAAAAVRLARRQLGELAGRTALLVGAGATAETAGRALQAAGVVRVIVANRGRARAEALVRRLTAAGGTGAAEAHAPERRPARHGGRASPPGCPAKRRKTAQAARRDETHAAKSPHLRGEAVSLERLGEALGRADVVIAATGAPGFVLRRGELARRLGPRRRPLWIADLGLPRDVDPDLAAFRCVTLHTMDDLSAGPAGARGRAVEDAEALVEEATDGFADWVRSLAVAPTIRRLEEHVAAMHRAQTRRYAGRFGDGEQLGRFARSVANKILHHPIAHLRRVAREGTVSERLAAVDTVRRMFDLDDEEPAP